MIALLAWASFLYALCACVALVGMSLRYTDQGLAIPGKVALWAAVTPALFLLVGVLYLAAVAFAFVAAALGNLLDELDVSPPERTPPS